VSHYDVTRTVPDIRLWHEGKEVRGAGGTAYAIKGGRWRRGGRHRLAVPGLQLWYACIYYIRFWCLGPLLIETVKSVVYTKTMVAIWSDTVD
jgi:hypothetical protein